MRHSLQNVQVSTSDAVQLKLSIFSINQVILLRCRKIRAPGLAKLVLFLLAPTPTATGKIFHPDNVPRTGSFVQISFQY